MRIDLSQLLILVIDDNKFIRRLLGEILRNFNVRYVIEAEDGADALEKLKLARPDIIFCDWVMTGMTGLEFTEKIRCASDSPNPFVPIIMLTGHTSIERVNAARDAGVNEFLAKPVSSKAILSRLIAVIEHPRPFVRTKIYFGPCRRRRKEGAHGPERRASELDSRDTPPNAA